MITEKTIWITGASSGIGKALVQQLAHQRNFLIVSGRSEEKLHALAQEVKTPMLVLPVDVADEVQMKQAEQRLKAEVGSLDMLIICAGTCEYQNDWRVDPAMHRRVLDTNYFGAVNSVHVALPLLKTVANRVTGKQTCRSRIVGISSMSTIAPFPRAEAYGASKAALEYFLNSLRIDVRDIGVDVTVVRPGFVDTPLTRNNDFDMPFIVTPEACATAIISGVAKGKTAIRFPAKLGVPLHLLSLSKCFWSRTVAPRLRKQESL